MLNTRDVLKTTTSAKAVLSGIKPLSRESHKIQFVLVSDRHSSPPLRGICGLFLLWGSHNHSRADVNRAMRGTVSSSWHPQATIQTDTTWLGQGFSCIF